MNKTLLLLSLLLHLFTLSSCAIYQPDFDCPVPCGVPCCSVTDLESMVEEQKQGADLFLPQQESAVNRICAAFKRKVWIADGTCQGCYLYQLDKEAAR